MRRGEATAVVTATGMRTKFGRTAELVRTAHVVSSQQKAVLRIVRNPHFQWRRHRGQVAHHGPGSSLGEPELLANRTDHGRRRDPWTLFSHALSSMADILIISTLAVRGIANGALAALSDRMQICSSSRIRAGARFNQIPVFARLGIS